MVEIKRLRVALHAHLYAFKFGAVDARVILHPVCNLIKIAGENLEKHFLLLKDLWMYVHYEQNQKSIETVTWWNLFHPFQKSPPPISPPPKSSPPPP